MSQKIDRRLSKLAAQLELRGVRPNTRVTEQHHNVGWICRKPGAHAAGVAP
jgi:hypothetical protein